MIDLTPLDVRKKRGDFKRTMRGFDPQEVDTFLELVAERLETLVKDNLALKERSEFLAEQVKAQEEREKAVQEALVTAQKLRDEIQQQAGREAETVRNQAEREATSIGEQARREAEMLVAEAESESRQLRERTEAEVAQFKQQAAGDTELLRKETESELNRLTVELERLIEDKTAALDDLERKRKRFLRAFRSLLERELDGVAVEEGKVASEESILELELTGGQRRARARMIETAALDVLSDNGAQTEEPGLAPFSTPRPEVPEAGEGSRDAEAVDVSEPVAEVDESLAEASMVADVPATESPPSPTEPVTEAIPAEEPVVEVIAPSEPAAGFTFELTSDGSDEGVAPTDIAAADEITVEAPPLELETVGDVAFGSLLDSEETQVDVAPPEEPLSEAPVEDGFTFGIVDSDAENLIAPDVPEPVAESATIEEAPVVDDAGLESLVDRILSDDAPSVDSVDPVVPIDNLAPEADQDSGARDSLEFHTKSGVSELFDRPADTAETPSPTGWDEVVKGASSEGDDATSEAEDTWSAESDEASDEGSESKGGWSRRRGQSRWR